MLAPPFLGFGPGAIRFFEDLAAENTKIWFDAHRDVFEAEVKGPLVRLFDEAAEHYGGAVKVFRQHRDVRFSKDKSPYKTSTYGMVHGLAGGRTLYASISATGFYAGTGKYELASDQLKRMRGAIDGPAGADLDAALAAARAAGLEVWENSLKTAPRGVARDHPRLHLMRMKNLVLGANLPPAESLDGRAPLEHAYRVWDAAAPINDWLEAHVGASTAPQRGR